MSGFAFLCAERTGRELDYAEQSEKISGNNSARDSFRRFTFGKIVSRVIERGDFLETAHLRL